MHARRRRATLVGQAVEESLRLHPARLFGFPRFATEDTELEARRSSETWLCNAAADLDPEVYPDPLRFDIRRDSKHVMVFGAGPHFCADAILARKIVARALLTAMDRFPDMRPSDPDWVPTYDGQLGEGGASGHAGEDARSPAAASVVVGG